MKNLMKKLHDKIRGHLKEDVKGYQKQRKNLKKEIAEDKDLMKKVKSKKSTTRKRKKKNG